MTPDDALTKVRDLALALPGAQETVSHGAPGFKVENGKFFAYFWNNHHNDGEVVVIVKTSGADEQAMLIEHQPDAYFRPAYLGASGWIALRLDRANTDWDQVADRVATSWELAAPRRLLEAGGR